MELIDINENDIMDNEAGGIADEADIVSSDVNNDAAGDIDTAVDTDMNDDNEDTVDSEETETAEVIDERRILEALLFASDELLTPAKLKILIPSAPDARRVRQMVAEINEQLEREQHPFEIVEAGGGYQFRTAAAFYPHVKKLYKERTAKKLSLQALECLAIIAYRQPITKAEVEAIRGVLSDGAMKTLLERKLVDICGRSEKPGRPLLYGTTGDFLKYFGINKVSDLPRIEEFEALARAKMEEMEMEELEVSANGADDGDTGGGSNANDDNEFDSIDDKSEM